MLSCLIALALMGVAYYLINRFLLQPYVEEPFKTIIHIAVIVFAVIYAAHCFGIF